MNEHQKFQQAFSHLHASADTLQEVMKMANKHPKARLSVKRAVLLAAALTLLISLAVVASASGLISYITAQLTPAEDPAQVLEEIYGNQISTEKPYMEDYLGNPIARPDMQRISLDSQAAEQAIGAYVSTAQGSFQSGSNTFRLCTFMIDEMGMGAFTWTAENPNGIYYKNIGYGMVDFNANSPFSDPVLTHHFGEESSFCDTFTFLIREENNGAKLHLVTYFGTTVSFSAGDTISWQMKDVQLEICPINYPPCHKLTCENGMDISLSYQGLILKAGSQTEIVPQRLELYFTDGTKYTVMDRGVYNQAGALWRKSDAVAYDELLILYNRLADPQQVERIELEYIWQETVQTDGKEQSVSRTEQCSFYP